MEMCVKKVIKSSSLMVKLLPFSSNECVAVRFCHGSSSFYLFFMYVQPGCAGLSGYLSRTVGMFGRSIDSSILGIALE